MPDDKFNSIMNYEFMSYICEGNESEKLDWFKVVNIAGEKLTEQELRNSVYTGEWLSDAKKYFSKRNCAAKGLSDKYIRDKWLLIVNKMAFALFASNILNLRKWKEIILSLGVKAVIQLQIIVKCCVEITMGRKRISTKK